MSPGLKECETNVMKLPVADRAILVEHLIESLDVLDDVEIESLWVKEAEARYSAYKQGRVSTRPAADAIRTVRDRIR